MLSITVIGLCQIQIPGLRAMTRWGATRPFRPFLGTGDIHCMGYYEKQPAVVVVRIYLKVRRNERKKIRLSEPPRAKGNSIWVR
jgi:hypothetical protein